VLGDDGQSDAIGSARVRELSVDLVHRKEVTTPLVSDAELVHLGQAGDIAAMAVLLDRHRATLYATALSVLRDRDGAMDAVQETFVVALTRLGDLREPGAVGAWLRTVVRNRALAQLRLGRRELATSDLGPELAAAGPERALDERVQHAWVWSALERLPEEERLALVLRHFTRCRSYEAIATVCGVPVGTVRSRLNRARRRLVAALATSGQGRERDQGELEASRAEEWETFYRRLQETPEPATYRGLYHSDVSVHDQGGSWTGIEAWSAEEREAIDVGVRASIVGLVASRTVNVVELDFHNPPWATGHCPPSSTFVHRLRDGRSASIEIYYHPVSATVGAC
jgi:RNA polymerase sigma-70 factor (ECF subfamily)